MSRDGGALRVVLPVMAGRYRVLLDFVWFCVWLAAEAALVASVAGIRIFPGPRAILIVPLVLFSAAGCFLAYRWLWYWGGRERFAVETDRLIVAREILGVGRVRCFPRERVRDIRARRMHYRLVYPSWGRMFVGTGDGEIVVEADGGRAVYGKGLGLAEAERLAELLRSELKASDEQPRRPTEFRLR
jgi:hypothetical protein